MARRSSLRCARIDYLPSGAECHVFDHTPSLQLCAVVCVNHLRYRISSQLRAWITGLTRGGERNIKKGGNVTPLRRLLIELSRLLHLSLATVFRKDVIGSIFLGGEISANHRPRFKCGWGFWPMAWRDWNHANGAEFKLHGLLIIYLETFSSC